eukprot:9107100-Alexandrium_andersonii.AAC.1
MLELVAGDAARAAGQPMADLEARRRPLANAICDASQTYGFHSLRIDGFVPTIATGADLFAFAWGRSLTPVETLVLMGFPRMLCELALQWFSEGQLRKFAGNAIHPAVAGVCSYSLLSLARRSEDDSPGDSEPDSD